MVHKNNSMSVRLALGATAALALAGTVNAAATTCTGATGTVNTMNALDGTNACKCVEGYTASTGQTYVGTTALTCNRCDSGYYISARGDTTLANGACTKIPADHFLISTYGTQGILATATAVETPIACPTGSTSVAGALTTSTTTTLAACKTRPGWYIKTGHASAHGSVVLKQINSGFYSVGGIPVTNTNAPQVLAQDAFTPIHLTASGSAGVSQCPYAGTSSTGATSLAECVPDCNTSNADSNAVAVGGTCKCAAGSWTTTYPKDAAGNQVYAAVKDDTVCVPCKTAYPNQAAGATTTVGADQGTSAGDTCFTAPGYYVSGPSTVSTAIVLSQAPANSYYPGGTYLKDAKYLESSHQCPKFSTSAAGSNEISDCKCVAGYSATANSCEPCAGRAAGDAVGTHVTCTATTTAATPGAAGAPAASGASSVSVFAAAAAIAAAQLVL